MYSPRSSGQVISLAASLVLVQLGLSFAQTAQYALSLDWEATLGPAQRKVIYRATACPNGDAFFTDSRGRIAHIDSKGVVDADRTLPELYGTTAIDCGKDGKLYAAVSLRAPTELAVVEPSTFKVTTRSLGSLDVFDIAAAEQGVFVLSSPPASSNSAHFLSWVPASGQAVRSFGTPPFQMDKNRTVDIALSGHIFWLGEKGKLAFLASNPYELHVYRPEGLLENAFQRSDDDFKRQLPATPLLGVLEQDEVMSGAHLPSGEFVTFVVKHRSQGSRSYLEILDSEFRPIATGIRVNTDGGYGILVDADASGALYFLRANPKGIVIRRARLNKSSD